MPATGGSTPSPRSRRANRPLPFMQLPAPPTFSQLSLVDSCPSRPPSPGSYHRAVNEMQSVLYGGTGTRRDITYTVDDIYDANATFENPLTLAKGRDAIAEMFSLLSLVPGSMHSESGEVAEALGYDGLHLAFLQHTLHISFLPFLESDCPAAPDHDPEHSPPTGQRASGLRRAYSFFSLPSTPHLQRSPLHTGDPNAPRPLTSKTHPSSSARWPISNLISSLMPARLAVSLTTVQIKLTTRLVFNEHGKIILHEDTWGLKEIFEGFFPIASHLYAINRQGVALVAGFASRLLLGTGHRTVWRDAEEQMEARRSRRYIEGEPGMATPEPDEAQQWERADALIIEAGARRDAAAELEEAAAAAHELDPDTPLYPAGSPISTRKSSISGSFGGTVGSRRASALGIEVEEPAANGSGMLDPASLGRRLSAEMASRPTVDCDSA